MVVSVWSSRPRCWVSGSVCGDGRCEGDEQELMEVATKREDGTEEPDSEIAIKKVLQDKRFKVRLENA